LIIGKRLRQLRTSAEMTQKELSQKLNLTPKMISFYEQGERVPPADILVKLADIFNVSADYLLGISDFPKYNSVSPTSEENFLCDRLEKLLAEYPEIDTEFYANVSQIPIDTFRQYISGKEIPGAYDLCKLVEVLETSVDYLSGRSDIPHPKHNPVKIENAFFHRMTNEMGRGFLETEVAEEMNLPISSIKALSNGEKMPDSETLFGLAQIFKKSTDYLLGVTECSRNQDIDGNYPFFFNKHVAERISKLMNSRGDDTYWADFLSISEDEVCLLKNYGFVIHVSVLNRLADMLYSSIDYLVGRTDSKETLEKTEESILLAYRNLNEENRSIAYGEILKIKKEQEHEEYIRSSSSVAAEDQMPKTGTNGQAK